MGDIEKGRENHLRGRADNQKEILETVSGYEMHPNNPVRDLPKEPPFVIPRSAWQPLVDAVSGKDAPPRQIFMSYRHEETAYAAGWLFDRLANRFGRDKVFKDVSSIVPGDDFVEVITAAVGSCGVLLALIGDRWLTITDQEGRRRLDDPDDFVRREIEAAALVHKVRVIPILFDGAKMPPKADLPTSIAWLANRQALELSPNRFDHDVDRLVEVLDKTFSSKGPQR